MSPTSVTGGSAASSMSQALQQTQAPSRANSPMTDEKQAMKLSEARSVDTSANKPLTSGTIGTRINTTA